MNSFFQADATVDLPTSMPPAPMPGALQLGRMPDASPPEPTSPPDHEAPVQEPTTPSSAPPVPGPAEPPALNVQKNPRGNIQFLTVIGQIEGHVVLPAYTKTTKYEHVIPMLAFAAESMEIDGVLVILNTQGGDVEAGLAIAELIANLGKPTVSLVLGGGHSIGVPLAVAANYSYIAPSAAMTIHPVRMSGTLVGAPQTYAYFNKMQERVLGFIESNSGITRERLRELMMDTSKLALDVGTILIGQETVDEKIIDAVGGLHDAAERLYGMIADRRAREKDGEASPCATPL